DANHPADFGIIDWEDTIPDETSIRQFEVRVGNVPTPDSSWTTWRWVTDGQDLSIFDGNRYIQYHVILGTDNLSQTPSLDKVAIEINVSALISSSFDTQDIRAGIVDLSWTEQLNGGDVVFQVRTSPNNVNWTSWCGPEQLGEDSTSSCETEEFYSNPTATQSIDSMFLDTINDQYMQYKAVLMSDFVGGSQIPLISQVDFDYDVPKNIERIYESVFTSRIFDTHYYDPDFGNIDWEEVVPPNTSLTIQVRSGSTSDPSLWTSGWQNVSNGSSLDFCDGSRYVQYRTTLGTDDLSLTSSLDKVVINSNVSTLVSSVYDSDDSNNLVDDLRWDETQNASSDDVLYQIRTSPDGINWTSWCGPEPVSENTSGVCDIYSFYTDPLGSEKEETMFRFGTDDQYMQYRAMLIADSISGINLPSISSTTLQYDIPDNSPRIYESTFTSRIMDSHHPSDFGTIRWINQIPADTSVRNFQVRAGNVSSVDASWTTWQSVFNWDSLDFFDGNRYIQYHAILGTDDLSRSPSLDRVAISTNVSALISSPFNSDDSRNMVRNLTWVEDRPGSSSVAFQIRTSPDIGSPTAWSDWCGPDNGGSGCDSESFFTNPSATKTIDNMFYDYVGDQYMQYKAILMSDSAGGGDLPSVSTTSLEYEPPIRSPRDYESTFTSRIFDLGNPFDLGGIYWNEIVPADTSIRIFARFGTGLNLGSITWSSGYEYVHDWEEIPSNEIEFGNDLLGVVIPEGYDGSRFVQYQVILGTDDLSRTPSFDKFLVEYFGGHLTSSVYSASAGQVDQMAITGISWEENWDNGELGDKFKLNLRTSSLPLNILGSEWIGVATSTFSAGSDCSVSASGTNQVVTCDISRIDQTLRDNNLDNVMQYRLDFFVSEDTSLGRANFSNFQEIKIDYLKNSPPEFGSVTSSQETIFDTEPGKVKIDYEIRDDDYDPATSYTYITPYFEYSSDGGSSWNSISSTSLVFATTSIQGDFRDYNSDGSLDVRVNESTYIRYLAYWDAKNDLPGIYATGTDIQIRIMADDWEAMFNRSTSTAMSFDLDTKDPSYSGNPISISGISAGTNYTTATITLTSFVDDSDLFRKIGFDQELLRNNPGFAWSDQFGGSGISTTIQLQTNPDIVYARVTDLYNNGAPIFGVASDHNVEGYAYDSLLGGNSFANFSCYYDTFNNCTPTSTFGVNIDRYTMNFSGFAYTDDGWISFESSSTPPDNYDFNVDCLDDYTCDGSSVPPCTACYNPQDGNVYGWALLNDNWIKLRGGVTGGDADVLLNRDNGEFEGLARSTSSPSIDYLYFNNLTEGVARNDPEGFLYKVILVNQSPPTITSLVTRIASSSDLCEDILDALNVNLEWEISDSDPLERSIAYEADVSDTTPVIIVSISGTTSPSAAIMGGSVALSGSQLDYDSDYSWRVRAADSFGLWSAWVDFDYSLPNHDILNYGLITDSDGNPQTFTTYLHEFPEPYFRWIPEEINQNTPIVFTATSSIIWSVFNPAPPSPSPFSTSSYQSLLWNTNDSSRVDIYSTTTPTTTIKFKFTSSTPVNVILSITDLDGYSCSTSSDFNINVLPDWIEVKTRD
ncbi:hypothetical protein K8R62_02015, partial [bacterium]|nr:hypothetical protein [bacterium]